MTELNFSGPEPVPYAAPGGAAGAQARGSVQCAVLRDGSPQEAHEVGRLVSFSDICRRLCVASAELLPSVRVQDAQLCCLVGRQERCV